MEKNILLLQDVESFLRTWAWSPTCRQGVQKNPVMVWLVLMLVAALYDR